MIQWKLDCRNRSYDSNYDSDSVANENHPKTENMTAWEVWKSLETSHSLDLDIPLSGFHWQNFYVNYIAAVIK